MIVKHYADLKKLTLPVALDDEARCAVISVLAAHQGVATLDLRGTLPSSLVLWINCSLFRRNTHAHTHACAYTHPRTRLELLATNFRCAAVLIRAAVEVGGDSEKVWMCPPIRLNV